jgi:hypothetical protein
MEAFAHLYLWRSGLTHHIRHSGPSFSGIRFVSRQEQLLMFTFVPLTNVELVKLCRHGSFPLLPNFFHFTSMIILSSNVTVTFTVDLALLSSVQDWKLQPSYVQVITGPLYCIHLRIQKAYVQGTADSAANAWGRAEWPQWTRRYTA